MPVRASPRTGRLKPMLRVPPPARNGPEGTPTPPPGPDKGKGKQRGPERRVLPARMRRAAGGGAEGIRDIEEMVVDWLERWGDIDPAPPESVVVRISTAPLRGTYAVDDASVQAGPSSRPMHAAPSSTGPTSPSTSPVTAASAAFAAPGPSAALSPALSLASSLEPAQPSPTSSAINTPVPGVKRIETPAWIMVKAGEDDAEEARQELVTGANRSPSKRLRHGVVGLELEDTSDAYYEAAHRRFEAFEKRQRIREREQLQFNRYKMRARVELLRNMPGTQWGAMVAAILARDGDDSWARGRRKLETMGNDWLRRHLIREGLEVLRRYDELLPKLGEKHKPASPASSSPPPQPQPKPVIKLRLFSSAQREAAAREAEAEERKRSRSSSVSSLSDCDPSSPASDAAPSPAPSAPTPSSVEPSPLPLRLKLARPKGGSMQTTLQFARPSPSPTKLPKVPPKPKPKPKVEAEATKSTKTSKTFRTARASTGSASTDRDPSPRKKLRRLSGDADTNRRRSLRSQPKNALGLVEDDEADMAGVEAEVLKL